MCTNSSLLLYLLLSIISLVKLGESVRCYQCSSNEDPKGQDNCGAYRKFDEREHVAVECGSEESHMPGLFCMKVTQQSPKGYIWDGRWRQVIRRCASVADTGVTGVCNWGVYENGIYWEECYCVEDKCNSSVTNNLSFGSIVTAILMLIGYRFL
ncbi:hypothetical protein WA026_010871 [Henosepilachna vigintioctopunctata]|uniref:Protein sleepless n=1 Tax=Henosepilachna vigintioctopunctata TaxID=420089 RepID=A0AAW1V0L2_9CUCU